MFINWAAVSRSSSRGILISLLLDSGHLPIVTFLSSPLKSQPHVGHPLAGDWEQASLGGKKHRSSSFLHSPCESASLSFTCKGARAPGMSFSRAYVDTSTSCADTSAHMYILNLPLLPQSDLCLLGLVHGYFKGRFPFPFSCPH